MKSTKYLAGAAVGSALTLAVIFLTGAAVTQPQEFNARVITNAELVVKGAFIPKGLFFDTRFEKADSGKTLVWQDGGKTIYTTVAGSTSPAVMNLPSIASLIARFGPDADGWEVTFVDGNATAAGDLTVNPANADVIGTESAGVSKTQTADVDGPSARFRYSASLERWQMIIGGGTWSQGS